MLIPAKFVKVVTPLALAISLAACGGAGSFGDGQDGGTNNPSDPGVGNKQPTKSVKAIEVRADNTKLLVDGSKPITITALAKDDKNIVIDNASFNFSVDKSATLIVNGNKATLTPGNSNLGDELTVTVKSGSKTETIKVMVVKEDSTAVTGGETVSAIDVRADSTKLFVDGSKPVTIVAITKNSLNNVISSQVAFSTTDHATLDVSGNTVTVTPDNAVVGESVVITIKSGNQTKTITLMVTEKETVAEGGETITAIDVRKDSKRLFADGTNKVTITALPKNIKNNAVEADVEFSSTDKVTLEVTGNQVVVTSDGATVGETVTILVKAGGVTKKVELDVTEQETVVEGGETVASIDVRADSQQLLVDGSKAISIIATPKNDANNAIEAEVQFSATGPATLVVSGKKASLTPDRANVGDNITVIVKAGGEERTLNFTVIAIDSEVQGGEVVSGIDVESDSTQLLADGSKEVKITAIPKNSDNNAISADVKFSAPNANVTIQSNGNTATITSDGAIPGSDITITIESGDVTKTVTLNVVDVAQEPVLNLTDMQIGIANLSAGGSTGLTIELKDQNGDYAKTEHTVTFTSSCVSNGSSEVISPIKSKTGVFTTTYTAKGCEGDDIITAEVEGLGLKKTATITVTPANLGAVEFVSAEPKNILLAGMSAPGMQHTSTVKFQIKNDVGGPIANADVSFELVTSSEGDGGIKLATLIGKTDNNGFVSTILQAGTVHTSVRVRATVDRNGTKISSESSELIISTGIADQNSLSLSLETLNPAAWNHDGVKVKANIYAADRYNNPVPDGTTVSFYTELGQIEPSCTTIGGFCSVTWTSADPRNLGVTDSRYPQDGITTITAKVIGEESFLDTNANGIFDDGDVFDAISDRGEAYADYNMNYNDGHGASGNHYDQGLDRFILDYNGNGAYDSKDGKYTGLGCKHSTLCAADNGLKDIFTSSELVMSEDSQVIRVFRVIDNGPNDILVYDATANGMQKNPALVTDPADVNYKGYTGDGYYKLTNNIGYRIEVFGSTNKQVPPVNTTIAASSEAAKIVTGSAKVPNVNGHGNNPASPYGAFSLPLVLEADQKPAGTVKVAINTGGLEATYVLPYEADNDGDGLPNSQDPDDDNDGINDADENAAGTNPFVPNLASTDTDNDGTSDANESDETSFTITDTNNNDVSDIVE